MTTDLKQLKENLAEETKKRDESLVQEAVLGKKTYRELGADFGISGERVKQILAKFNIKIPLVKGSEKWEKWRERISKTKKGVKHNSKGRENETHNL